MALAQQIVDAVYQTDIGLDAVYSDLSKDEQSIRVIKTSQSENLLIGADVGVRGQAVAFRLRISSVARKPARGETLTVDSVTYCIDDCDELNRSEYICYVHET